jgi:pyrimidine deaminase RibD-like protein
MPDRDMADDYAKYMRIAVDVGKQSQPEDNRIHPRVGAVLVSDGFLLGTAFRGELGRGDHAEYTLFEKKLRGADLRGATLLTTLEPCVSRQEHKPCSEWIVEKGVARVFIGMLDPNPRIYDRGASMLRSEGTEVRYFSPDLRAEVEADNHDFVRQFRANPVPVGTATFNYTDNNGLFTIGHGQFIFDTKWTKASDIAIHIYNDPDSIVGVAVVTQAAGLSDIVDASIYDMSSRYRTVRESQFVVMQNEHGYYACLHVLDIRDGSRQDNYDELTFDYWILTDKTRDFSRFTESM